ncbi:MAG: hypothetical protein ACRC8B_22585 [Aeromonas sobria]|uniref:hypothetical protein n=1 Tax=Aeromonas sobria TaxID=646 RepID=UPI003F38A00B
MKKMMLCAFAVLALSACAVPVEMQESHAAQRQALRTFHKAERQEYRAGELVDKTTTAAMAAKALRLLSEAETERALAALESEMNK